MKKLKLKALKLGAKEMLSREQLRNVLGGTTGTGTSGGGGGTSFGCSTGPCTLTIQNQGTGTYTTFPGTCAASAAPVGTIIGAIVTCYCNAVGAPVPLSSNGGISKCGSGGVYMV